tara:strand:+ start:994 stop:1356 length:363 start_codon:yes stop_codon:yes gene_type:complete
MALDLSLDLILGVEEKHNHRVRKFGYGDGYEQLAPDGINSLVREYNITTIPFSSSQYETFKAALDAVCVGDTFLIKSLQPFISTLDGVHFRLVDNTYSVDYLPAADKYRFSFGLREAFVN